MSATEMIPAAMKPIAKQHGVMQSDGEGKATRRLLHCVNLHHPNRKLVVADAGRSSNASHIISFFLANVETAIETQANLLKPQTSFA